MKHLLELVTRLRSEYLRLVLLSVLVGIVAGFGALAFNFILDAGHQLLLVDGVGYEPPLPGGEGPTIDPGAPRRPWALFFIPALGGLVAGILVFKVAPEAEGHGSDAMVDAFHRKRGAIRKRVPLVKTIASALTIGSGGSAGREGPIAQIGAGFGSTLGAWLKTTDRERRLLMLAGAGAGVGAVFRAPLGGALFASEVLYREIEFESQALVPTFIASITSYSIYCGVTGHWGAIFSVPDLQFTHPVELFMYAALGLACAWLGIVYVKVFYGVRDRIFRPLRLPRWVKPALGGLAVGAIGYFLPQVLSMGYGWVQLAMEGSLSLKLIMTVALVKILVTGLTISSGGSGGVFAPSMVIGGLLGAGLGTLFQQTFPNLHLEPAAFALVGMAGFFAGVAKTPVSSMIMVSEMTRGYGLLAPLMLTVALGYVLTPKRISIYEKQVDERVDSPAHEGEFVIDVLERITVRDAMPAEAAPTVFTRDTALPVILEAVAESRQEVFPVLDDDGKLHGVIDFQDIRIFFTEHELPSEAVVAQDLLAPAFTAALADEDLGAALRKFRRTRLEQLPVIEDTTSLQVIGMLSRRDVIAAYHDRMYQRTKG